VVINEAVINDGAEPEYRSERLPRQEGEEGAVPKSELKVVNTKSA